MKRDIKEIFLVCAPRAEHSAPKPNVQGIDAQSGLLIGVVLANSRDKTKLSK